MHGLFYTPKGNMYHTDILRELSLHKSWRDGSVVKNTCCSPEDKGLISTCVLANSYLQIQFQEI